MKNNIHPIQFSIFRIILGIYLFLHFLYILPFGQDLFGNEGMLSEASMNLTWRLFPFNILNWLDNTHFIRLMLLSLIIASILFTAGIQRRLMAGLLLYGWMCLFNRNNLILTPSLAFIGWFLLLMMIIPKGEPLSISRRKTYHWEVPQIAYAGTWFIMSLSYTMSGIDKLNSTSWLNGSAVSRLLENPLMRDHSVVQLLSNQPDQALTCISWFILLIELMFFPVALFNSLKPFIWLSMVLLHIGILIFMNMADLSISMLLIHFFTFNPAWITRSSTSVQTVNSE